MPRIEYTAKVIEEKFPLSLVPVDCLSKVVKGIKYELGMNRYCRPFDVSFSSKASKDEKEKAARITYLLGLLWSLGFGQKFVTVEKNETFWRKARLYPSKGTRAISGVSHKYRVTAKVRIMQITLPNPMPVDSKGKALYSEIFCDCIYISGTNWKLGYTSGNPYAISDPKFQPWDEPFLSYEKDKPRIRDYTDRPKRLVKRSK